MGQVLSFPHHSHGVGPAYLHKWAPRDQSCARREAREGSVLALCARDQGVRFQSGLRTDPAPLRRCMGSAGPVLRSQGTLGPAGTSRWRARGNRMSTFQCSLRTDPAPLRRWVRSAGPVLRSQGTLGPVGLSRWRARGNRMSTFQCSLRTDPAPLGWSCCFVRRERWGASSVARRWLGARRDRASWDGGEAHRNRSRSRWKPWARGSPGGRVHVRVSRPWSKTAVPAWYPRGRGSQCTRSSDRSQEASA